MDMITEHNYGVPIPLNKENDASHMEDIHTEMLKRLLIFLALPAMVLFSSIIWLTYDWPGIVKAIIENRRRKLRRKFKNVNSSFRLIQGFPIAQSNFTRTIMVRQFVISHICEHWAKLNPWSEWSRSTPFSPTQHKRTEHSHKSVTLSIKQHFRRGHFWVQIFSILHLVNPLGSAHAAEEQSLYSLVAWRIRDDENIEYWPGHNQWINGQTEWRPVRYGPICILWGKWSRLEPDWRAKEHTDG